MSYETCTLTTKDFTIIQAMHDSGLARDDRIAPILKRKIDSAHVMFRDDIPDNVATLGSRVDFMVDGQTPERQILSQDRMTSAMGTLLPITTLRGLALLGLSEGQEFSFLGVDGYQERVRLVRVLYQPEAASRKMALTEKPPVSSKGRSMLNVILRAFREPPPEMAPKAPMKPGA
ncbi:nucleoside-diphosphate kinase [Mesorhizobium sp. 2RAF21]|uniref:nucleoside-diphosphate kinase n=1 Tax=Mesorhizobium sp. 2RAF21 TaxID=3232995 RepID=UPI003F9B0EA2